MGRVKCLKSFSKELWCLSIQCFCQTCSENTSLMPTPLHPILKLTEEQIYSDLKTAKTPKHDVVCPERTGHSRKLLVSAPAARQKPERNVQNHKNPLPRSNKRSAVTHEMLSRMLHFTDCAWIFHEHYPEENQRTSVLSVQRKCRSAWKSTGII